MIRKPLYRLTDDLSARIVSDAGKAYEVWKPVHQLPYHVSNFGRVRSDRSGRTVALNTMPNGYQQAHLYLSGKRFHKYVHRLVAAAFCGPRPTEGHEVAHRDGVRSNNDWRNLRWATRRENHLDKRRHGTMLRGERHHRARLTALEVIDIRRRASAGEMQKTLAAEYQVGEMTISRAVRRVNWSHINA